MYQIFTNPYTGQNTTIRPPGFDLVKQTLEAELLHITNYFANRVFSTKNTHLLVRLLNAANIPQQYTLDRYAEVAFARSPYVARLFNFTSETSYGGLFKGEFYGGDNTELILYTEEYFSPFEAVQNWKAIRAVQVLEHPMSDMGLILPNGKQNSSDSGFCVIAINLPLLLVQYRGFVAEQAGKLGQSMSQLGVTHFVYMYVLPNMLYSHLDIVIYNRLSNLHYGAPMGVSTRKYPFPLSDYSSKLDRVLVDVLKRIQGNALPYAGMLKMIPSVTAQDGLVSLHMPDYAKTRQVWWALVTTRFRQMKLLIDVGSERGLHANTSLIAKLKIDLKRLLDENILRSMLPDDLYFDMVEEIDSMLHL